jgi:hypothetical protein
MQASAEHFQPCAEFSLLRNRGLRPLAVTVLAIPLARRAARSIMQRGGVEKMSVHRTVGHGYRTAALTILRRLGFRELRLAGRVPLVPLLLLLSPRP